jgi:hypothetical protein
LTATDWTPDENTIQGFEEWLDQDGMIAVERLPVDNTAA